MALQSSGGMTMEDVLTELGKTSGSAISFDDADLLSLIGKTQGQSINFPQDFYGASFGTDISVTCGSILPSSMRGYKSASSALLGDPAGSVMPFAIGGANIASIQVNINTNILIFEVEGLHAEGAFDSITFVSNQSGNPEITKDFLTGNSYYTQNVSANTTQWNFSQSDAWATGETRTIKIKE